MKNIFHNSIFSILFLIFLFSTELLAQDTNNDSEKVKEEPVSAIPATEIIQKLEDTNNFLKISSTLLETPADIINIEQNYTKFIDQIGELNIYSDPKKLEQLSARELADQYQKCTRDKKVLSEWIATLTAESGRIEVELQKTKRWIEIWDKTVVSATEQNLPRDIVSSIRSTINTLVDAEKKMSDQLNKILSIQNKISAQEIILSDLLSELEKNRSEKKKDLLLFDSKPLWSAVFDLDNQPAPLDQLKILYETHRELAAEFLKNYRIQVVYHIITFIMLFILLMLIKKYSNLWVSETDAVKVLSRPFSQALLISMLFNSSIYLVAPNIILYLHRIVIMILILRMLPVSFNNKIRNIIYGFAVIHILQQLHLLSFESTLIQRLIILIISFSALFIIYKILQYNKHKVLDIQTKSFKFFIGLMRVTMALIIISIVSNIFGNVSLADHLNYGVMHSIYSFLGIAISINIIIALFTTLLYSRYANYLHSVQKQKETITKVLTKVLGVGSFVIWSIIVLNAYGIYEPLYDLLQSIFGRRFTMGSVNISLGDVVVTGLTIWIAFWISKFIRFFLEGDVLSRIKLPRGVPGTISKLTHYLILGFGFVIALSMAGFDLTKMAFIAGALGVGIGFGLQNIVNNFISGLILIFERPIQTGDVIELGNLLGVVKKIGIRASMIRSYTGAEVIVPNGNLISNEVINWTLSDKLRRIEIRSGCGLWHQP